MDLVCFFSAFFMTTVADALIFLFFSYKASMISM